VGGAFVQDRDVTYTQSQAGSRTTFTTSDEQNNQYGAAVGWDNKQFGLAFSWQGYRPDNTLRGLNAFYITLPTAPGANDGGLTGVQYDTVNAYTVQGQYYFGSEVLRLSGSYIKPKDLDSKLYVFEAGFQHNLSKRTRLWLEYIRTTQNFDNQDFTVATSTGTRTFDVNPDDANMNVVSAGIRHDF
jgi:predicted porin